MTLQKNSLVEKDLKYIWHPCSQMKDYETLPPIVIERGKGAVLTDVDGNTYLDCISSWWCNLHGHSHPVLNQAITNQLSKLEHVIFANFSHTPAIQLAESLVKLTPNGLEKVFFSDNGSAAIEIAMKMSFHWHQQTGQPQRRRFAALSDAYHGETLGALSVSDLDLYSQVYKPLMLDVLRLPAPDCYRCSYELNRETCTAPCFEKTKAVLDAHAHEISAVLVEPLIQCAAGMKIYPASFLKQLYNASRQLGCHLIADEIAVGFGRTGKLFACEHAEINPDFMCLSKGLTGGYMPMSVVMTTQSIYDAFYDDYNTHKAFLHSHTYSGNAMACAVALASLELLKTEHTIEKNVLKGALLNRLTTERAKHHPYVGEVRSLGMLTAIELVLDPLTKTSFSPETRVGYEIYKRALKKGLLLRPLGNVLYFLPPYCVTEEQLSHMVNICFECIDDYFETQSPR
jgi:adenosylmethionine-8-amino-7-oxononanoate aminotransferase